MVYTKVANKVRLAIIGSGSPALQLRSAALSAQRSLRQLGSTAEPSDMLEVRYLSVRLCEVKMRLELALEQGFEDFHSDRFWRICFEVRDALADISRRIGTLIATNSTRFRGEFNHRGYHRICGQPEPCDSNGPGAGEDACEGNPSRAGLCASSTAGRRGVSRNGCDSRIGECHTWPPRTVPFGHRWSLDPGGRPASDPGLRASNARRSSHMRGPSVVKTDALAEIQLWGGYETAECPGAVDGSGALVP